MQYTLVITKSLARYLITYNLQIILIGDKVVFDEKKYFLKTILKSNFASIIAFSIIIAIGIFALTSNQPPENIQNNAKAPQQILKSIELLTEVIKQNVNYNYEKANYAIESYTKNFSGFKLVPDIPFDFVDAENLPDLFYNNQNVKTRDRFQINPFIQSLKSIANSDILIYQRISQDGDMLLVSHSFYELPEDFSLNLISQSRNKEVSELLAKIFKGQPYTILQKLNENVYAITFRRLIDRRGKIIGMLAVMQKLTGKVDLNISLTNYKLVYLDKLTSKEIFSQGQLERKSTLSWADSLLQNAKQKISLIQPEWGRAAYYDNDLHLLITFEIPFANKIMPSGLRANGVKMVLAVAILVLILVVFYTIQAYDRFSHKINEKEQFFINILKKITTGDVKDTENEFTELSFKGELKNNLFLQHLRHLNKEIINLKQDKTDLQDIIDTKVNRIILLVDKINQSKLEIEEKIVNTIEQFTDFTVRITQITTAVVELSRWEVPSEISDKFNSSSICEKIREKSKSIRTKSSVLIDKIDKIHSELNQLKKTSDHTYLIAVNSSIFAEKASSNKLEVLSAEIKKISENLTNSQDQLYYLVSEARNALFSCNYDLETIEVVLDNTPKQSDLAKMLLEYSRFNERLASISTNLQATTNEFRSALKSLENSKTLLLKLDGIIDELVNISEQI